MQGNPLWGWAGRLGAPALQFDTDPFPLSSRVTARPLYLHFNDFLKKFYLSISPAVPDRTKLGAHDVFRAPEKCFSCF